MQEKSDILVGPLKLRKHSIKIISQIFPLGIFKVQN